MRRFLLVALVGSLGCNYYGPDNPPPYPAPPPPPSYRYDVVLASAADGVAFAPCPPNSVVVGGGGDCITCAPTDPSADLFGSIGFETAGGVSGWIVGCYPGCAAAQVTCLTSSAPGTISRVALADVEAIRAPYLAAIAARAGLER